MVGPHGAEPLDEDDPVSVGPYDLLGRLGDGGMGSVYLARRRVVPAGGSVGSQVGDGSAPLVALKMIRSDLARVPEFRERFLREAQAAQRVARFCTAEVIDVGTAGRRPYLVTEFIDGPTLMEAVRAGGPMPPAELERLAVAVASALTAIHAAGVIHRDLKPGNILLSPSGARVIDFGIARALDVTQTLTHGSIGTPGFMAPEQALGRPVAASADVYAWGAVVLFAASGRPPFEGDSTPVVLRRVVEDVPDLSPVHHALRPLVARAMSKTPEHRPSAEELLLALHRVAARPARPRTTGQTVPSADARPTPPSPTSVPSPSRTPPPTPAPASAPVSTPTPPSAVPTPPSGSSAPVPPAVLAGTDGDGEAEPSATRRATPPFPATPVAPVASAGAGGSDGGGPPDTGVPVPSPIPGWSARPVTPVRPVPAYTPVPEPSARGGPRGRLLALVAGAVALVVAVAVVTVVVANRGGGGRAGTAAAGGSGAAAAAGARLVGYVKAAHGDVIRSAVLSSDGRTLATGGDDHAVRLWDVSDPARPAALGEAVGPADTVRSVAFSPDGTVLAAGGADLKVWLWDVSDPSRPQVLGEPLAGFTGWVMSVAFSPDGQTMVTGADGVRLWDVSDPAAPRALGGVLGGVSTSVQQLAFQAGVLAAGYSDASVRLWDVSDPAAPVELGSQLHLTDRDANNIIYAVALSGDAQVLVVGGLDRTVRLWRLLYPEEPRSLAVITVPAPAGADGTNPLAAGIWSVALSPDGTLLAAGSGEDGVLVWDLDDPAAPVELGNALSHGGASVEAVVFSAGGRLLVTGDWAGTLRLWSLS